MDPNNLTNIIVKGDNQLALEISEHVNLNIKAIGRNGFIYINLETLPKSEYYKLDNIWM